MAGRDDNQNDDGDFLLDGRPEEWPPAWRDLRARSEAPMPSGLDDRILGAMREALDESKSEGEGEQRADKSLTAPLSIFRSRGFKRAAVAAAVIPLALGAFLWYQSTRVSPGPLRVISAAGIKVDSPEIRAGRKLELPPNAIVYLRFEKDLAFRLQGPGRFDFPAVDGNQRSLHIRVTSGSIAVHGEKSAMGRSIVWSTERFEYRMMGTTALLRLDASGEELLVRRGAFRARDSRGREYALPAGRTLKAPPAGKGHPVPGPLAPEAGRRLDALAAELKQKVGLPTPVASPGKSPGKKSPPKTRRKLHSLKELRAKHGSVQLIRLKGGRRIIGHMRFQGDSILIFSEYGPLRIKRSRFLDAQEY